jgi:hypothetical protein
MTSRQTQWQDNMQNAWAALRMIRETVETLGPSGSACAIRPEPIHEATAIVEALTTLLGPTDENSLPGSSA